LAKLERNLRKPFDTLKAMPFLDALRKVIIKMFTRLYPFASSAAARLALLLGLIAAFAVWLLLYSTPEGLGLNDDSVAYVSGARGMLSGEGYRELWLVSKGPLTHFPPGYSGMLAVIGFVSRLDPIRVARMMNALFFGGNAFLLGLLCWRVTKSQIASTLLAALFVAAPAFLKIHSNAMSEPQYIFLTLVTILLFDIYFERGEIRWLIAAGVVVSLAYLTRYAALALIATIFFSLFILHADWRTRTSRAVIFLFSALPLMLAWSIRNKLIGGTLTNRSPGWHPITADSVTTGLREFSLFITPYEPWRQALNKIPGFYFNILVLVGAVLLIWILIAGLRRFFQPKTAPQPPLIPFVNGLYILGYFSSLVVTMTVFDPATKFQLRILAPLFVSLLFLAVAAGVWLARKRPALRAMLALLALFFLGLFAYGQNQTARELSRGGQLYASYRWYDSKILALVRKLPPDVTVHTNQPEAVYLYTGRACALLPGEDSMAETQRQVLQGRAVIVLFISRNLDQETVHYYEELGRGLNAIYEGSSVMYTAFQ
jgi:hypothetical protein